jgi:hypothetical protein
LLVIGFLQYRRIRRRDLELERSGSDPPPTRNACYCSLLALLPKQHVCPSQVFSLVSYLQARQEPYVVNPFIGWLSELPAKIRLACKNLPTLYFCAAASVTTNKMYITLTSVRPSWPSTSRCRWLPCPEQ